MKKYRIIKYKGLYQVQKRMFFFFWRTIKYNNDVDLKDTIRYAHSFRPIYTFKTNKGAVQFLKDYKEEQKKCQFTIIDYYE